MIAISSTLISRLSLDGFQFRFHTNLVKGCSSVSKAMGSLLKAIKRSQSRSAICFYFCRGHVNFISRIKATTAEFSFFSSKRSPSRYAPLQVPLPGALNKKEGISSSLRLQISSLYTPLIANDVRGAFHPPFLP